MAAIYIKVLETLNRIMIVALNNAFKEVQNEIAPKLLTCLCGMKVGSLLILS
jgi:hypothetical protein